MEKENGFIVAGLGLITLAFVPTPDDVTVVSPLLQILVGAGLVGYGVITKNHKK
jgi:hypothetical protein